MDKKKTINELMLVYVNKPTTTLIMRQEIFLSYIFCSSM